eukprot:CAMPEP_0172397844 /NCGR_PEP_ID=MMETSP1061-20121228/33322_1 /TAXON_ID=37318 /ORGANISM="Pseudo-nitzschia pungens, Strain cf. pungens" /LENGTH=402 /DNA_ID=CAMNT_0013130169 /DNA_START=114 /DNA_END=1322 /DNA_ORIENTATION=+
MKHYGFVGRSLFFSVLLASKAIADTQNEIISWVRSKGGSFSEKLEIRRVDPENPASYLGVFAKERIGAKEDLFHIPRDCFIHIFEAAKDTTLEDIQESMEAYLYNVCTLVHKLKSEMELGEDSDYAPYIAYLKTQKPGQLPAHWSTEGRDILRQIAYPGSSIVDWIDRDYVEKKCIDNDPFERHMVEMTIQRCFDTALIPIWDMVNHDNGRVNTENNSMHDLDGIKVLAKRNLEAGEEIFASYDLCVDCSDIDEDWGTPEILRDFGFVENYPHRWIFLAQDIWIEIHKRNGQLLLSFGEENGQKPIAYSEEKIRFLRDEFERLEKVGASVLQNQGSVPDHEWSTILQFHKAATSDMTDILSFLDNQEHSASRSRVFPPQNIGDLDNPTTSTTSSDACDTGRR